jgi:hypothetical protein
MADSSLSILFDAVLQDYEKKTGITLASHPFAAQLDSSHSVESITTVLLGQVQAFSGLQTGDRRIIKSIKNIVSIIASLSATSTLGYAVGFVSHKMFKLMAYSTALTAFTVIPICNTRCSRYPTRGMGRSLVPI